MMVRNLLAYCSIAATVLWIMTFPAEARATDQAKCKVMTIHASPKEGKTDEKLKNLPFLKEAPFNTYKSFRLLSDKTYLLTVGVPVALALPVQADVTGKLTFQGVNEALKELNFKLYLIKSKSKKPEQINFAVHGKAPFIYVRPFGDGLMLLSIQCTLAEKK